MKDIHLAIECVGTKHSGGATVLRDLLPVLAADSRFSRIVVYTSPRTSRSFDLPSSDRMEERERPREERSYLARVAWYQWGLAETCRRDGIDVLLCANGMGRGGDGLPRIALIQQALPYSKEALATLTMVQRVKMGLIRRLTCHVLRSATAVVAQSPAMAETLRFHCNLERNRIKVCRPSVCPLPTEGGGAVRSTMGACASNSRLLYVGNTAPYKNLRLVAGAIGRLRKFVPDAVLFVTCQPEEPVCRGEGVVALGYLDAASLAAAYDMATVIVQPSLIESGPLVPPEARRAGRPLLVADRLWARDACGDGALFFDPNSESEFLSQAVRLLSDSDLRAMLVKNGAAWQRVMRDEDSYQDLADLLVLAQEQVVDTRRGLTHV